MAITIPQDWMPAGLAAEDKTYFAGLYPTDPHRAAAEAWEAYAASLDPTAGDNVTNVSTGAQSVAYGPGGSGAYGQAMGRVAFHRARQKVRSVRVGGEYEVDHVKRDPLHLLDEDLEEDE